VFHTQGGATGTLNTESQTNLLSTVNLVPQVGIKRNRSENKTLYMKGNAFQTKLADANVSRKDSSPNIKNSRNVFLQKNGFERKNSRTQESQTKAETPKNFEIKWDGEDWPRILSQLHFGHCLGQGSFAKVYEGIDKIAKKQVAIKVIDKRRIKDKKRRVLVEKEVSILSRMNHKNIVKLEKLLEDHKRIFLVTELCGSNTLSRYCRKKQLKRLDDLEAYSVFKQVVDGVRYIHKKGFCHRDLKLTNILIDHTSIVKIIDFGFASTGEGEHSMYCGTPSYMAPEIVDKKSYDGLKVDVWAIGVVLYKLLTGEYPFGGILKVYYKPRMIQI